MLESTLLGSTIAAVVLVVAVSAVRVQAAGDLAQETARVAADHAARWGDAADAEAIARRLVPDGEVTAHRRDGTIVVAVRITVPLLGGRGAVTVTGRAEATVAPHRSRR
ncbi:MAG: hypothetical protein R3290_03520 [Acidimicrobiia bacterium]|nr:hypothetical protein [Acidimicrobiia bacterium]